MFIHYDRFSRLDLRGDPIHDHQCSRLELFGLVHELFGLDNFRLVCYSQFIYNDRFSRLHWCGYTLYNHQLSRFELFDVLDELFDLDNFITDVILVNFRLIYFQCIYNHGFSRLELCD